MSGDNLVQVQSEGLKRRSDAKNFDRKVDINILLNKVRAEEKKDIHQNNFLPYQKKRDMKVLFFLA